MQVLASVRDKSGCVRLLAWNIILGPDKASLAAVMVCFNIIMSFNALASNAVLSFAGLQLLLRMNGSDISVDLADRARQTERCQRGANCTSEEGDRLLGGTGTNFTAAGMPMSTIMPNGRLVVRFYLTSSENAGIVGG